MPEVVTPGMDGSVRVYMNSEMINVGLNIPYILNHN